MLKPRNWVKVTDMMFVGIYIPSSTENPDLLWSALCLWADRNWSAEVLVVLWFEIKKLLWNRSELSWIHQSCSVDLIVIAGFGGCLELSLEGWSLLDVWRDWKERFFFFVGAYWNIFPQEVKFVVEMRFENYSILVFFCCSKQWYTYLFSGNLKFVTSTLYHEIVRISG